MRLKKDGTPDKRANNGGNKNAGRKTKAEEMGLEKRLNRVFQELTDDRDDVDGADVVLVKLRDIALDPGHSKHFEALKWFTDRYFGKEPKALIVDQEVNHNGVGVDVAAILKGAYGNKDKSSISGSTDE